MRRWRVALIIFVALSVVGVAGLFSLDGDLELADKLASIGSFVLGGLGLFLSVLALGGAQPEARSAPTADRSKLEQLAESVERQWLEEAERRGLNYPLPLSVRWSAADATLMGHLSAIVGGRVRAGDERGVRRRFLSGSLAELAEKFVQLPTQRLVVLGEPGAGKTVLAIQLVLALLQRRVPGDPVPVLLSLASWNSHEQHLHAWMTDQLEQTYPGLLAPAADGSYAKKPTLAASLVRQRLVLPVLDGLDELPEHLRPPALNAMNRVFSAGAGRGTDPMVVTCRVREYRDLLIPDGSEAVDTSIVHPLVAAAAVELRPIELEDVETYLLQATPSHFMAKWDPVFARMRQDPGGPLAQALSTPLMVGLARAGYGRSAASPAALLESRFSTRLQIEDHLLDQLIPTVYTDELGVEGLRPYGVDEANRWFRFLAAYMAERNTRDIAWWGLIHTVPRAVRGIAFGLMFGAVVGPAYGLAVALVFGIGIESVGGSPVGVPIQLAVGLGGGVAGGVVYGLVGGLRVPPTPSAAEVRVRGNVPRILRWLAVGLTAGFAIGFGAGLLGASGGGLGDGIRAGLVFGAGGMLVFGLVSLFGHPVDITSAVDPKSVLRADRVSSLVFEGGVGLGGGLTVGLGGGLAVGLGGGAPPFGLGTSLVFGLGIGFLIGLVVALVRGRASAWDHFGFARVWLASRRRVPWRVMEFLEDAHRRGVLRRVGAVYQFRHARLQDRMAVVRAEV